MQTDRLIILLFFVFSIAAGCNNNVKKNPGGSMYDSSQAGRVDEDSTKLAYTDCYEIFFKALPKFKDSMSASLILQNGKRITLTRFFKDEFMSQVSEYGKKDLDGDGKEELIVFNNTGGAHCCDEYYIFSQKKDNEFQFKAHLMGGETCIDATDNTFTYSFSETFGYFFTCYACEFNDSTGTFHALREVQLKYDSGKLQVIPYNSADEKQNLTNLEILQNHGFEKVEGLMDSGWRKEFAMNLAVWHYNHNKDLKQTKALFDRYYNFQDAVKVWKEFYSSLQDFGKENTF